MKHTLFLVLLFFTSVSFAQKDPKQDSIKLAQAIQSEADDRAKKFLPQYAPLSPNASSFQKFGDYQVNLATGIPSISIPLLTVQNGSLSMPIILNYHAGGFKMNEQASWVGWGWSLDSGLSVNRTVQGLKDDRDGGSYLTNPITVSRDFCNNSTDYYYGQSVVQNQTDTQPDIFSYSLPSKNGKFLLGQNGASPFKIPDYPIQISYSGSPSISAFDLVDDTGVQYIFDVGERQSVISGSSSQFYTSSWLISQIKSPNSDDVINYTYQSGGGQFLSEKQWVASMLYGAVPQSGGHYSNSTSCIPTYTTVSTSITQINPSKITYTNGEVEFIQSNAGERQDLSSSHYLKQINVYNYESGVKTLIKVIKFTYSYFSGIRLKLDKISITDENNSLTEEYSFDYWTNTISWNENNDNEKKDFFGYYNGKPNTHLIPVSSYQGISIYGGAADRSTVDTYMKEGVLKRITFPTKGYSEFDYETNQYNNGTNNVFAGGLRVKNIKSVTGGSSFMKRYEYSSNAGAGIGRLTTNWTPTNAGIPNIQFLRYDDQEGTAQSFGTIYQASFTQSGGAVDLNTMDTAPVYYTDVTEYFEDANDPTKNGRNVYNFDFYQDLIVNALNYQSRNVQPWKRGNLQSKTTYDAANNAIAFLGNDYQEHKINTRLAGAFVNVPNVYSGFGAPGCPTGLSSQFPQMLYGSVYYQTGINLAVGSSHVINNVSTSQSTVYTSNLLVAQNQSTDSRTGDTKTESFIYPTDPSYASNSVAQSMLTRNMLNIPLETTISEGISGNVSTIYKEKKVFDFFSGNNARGLSNNILWKELWSAPKGNTLEKRVVFTDYATNGNLLSYKVDDLPISLLWAYNDALLVAEVKNATNLELGVELSSLGLSVNDFSVSTLSAGQLSQLQSLRNALPNAHFSWYSYRPQVGLSNMVSSNGIVSRFAYDKLNRLQSIKDHSSYLTDLYNYVYATTAPTGCTNPDAPSIAVSASNLCDATLTASGCSGTVNWSNGGAGGSISVSTKTTTIYTATCTVSGCTSSASSGLTIPVLPSGWTASEIGSPPLAGCVQEGGGIWTIKGSGNTYATADNLNYVYKNVSGNAVIVAKINSISANAEGMRSGIMLRANSSPTADYYQFFFDSGYQVLSLYEQNSSTGDGQLGYQATSIPSWIRLKKEGNTISVWYTQNATPAWNNDSDWTLYTSVSSSLFNSSFLMGIHAYNNAYNVNSQMNQTEFSNVSINNF
jgi:hypothetical protein